MTGKEIRRTIVIRPDNDRFVMKMWAKSLNYNQSDSYTSIVNKIINFARKKHFKISKQVVNKK